MAEIIMPKMGDAMTEGKVVRWYKKAGEPVKKGEPLLEIETDKVNLDLEAEQDGTIGDVAVQEGQMAPVGGRLATILGAGEKPAAASGG
ncbi:MAG TPA: biotin/lipoyl-containing protein, partial [Thermoanaerobaculia bacterium]